MKKKTAVEWLKQEFFSYADPYPYFSEEDKWVITERELLELIEKAKEMEKEQIIEARMDGINSALKGYAISNEQYYNETYRQHESME